MKDNSKKKEVVLGRTIDLAKKMSDKMPLIKSEDANSVFEKPAYEETMVDAKRPSVRKMFLDGITVGSKWFADGRKVPNDGLFGRKNISQPTEENVFWQNDVVFVRRMKKWLIKQGFTFDSWCCNYYDPENKIIRTSRVVPSVWLSVSNKEKNLLCEIVHVHGRRGYLVRTRQADNKFAPTIDKVCETIIGVKNYIKTQYKKDDTDDLLEAAL